MTDVLITARQTPSGDVLDGVLVRVYSGATLVTSGVTGEGANAEGTRLFDLAAGDYTMRLSMSDPGYAVVSPQTFTVTGEPEDDTFVVRVSTFENPESADPHLCACSGYLVCPDGSPAERAVVRFAFLDAPAVLGRTAVVPRKVTLTADAGGYGRVDLIRQARYRVEFEGYPDIRHEIMVPDLAGANLADVVFPVVESVAFSPTSVSAAVGDTIELTATFHYRSGLELDLSDLDDVPLRFVASAPGVQLFVDHTIRLVAATAGSFTISVAARTDVESPITVRPPVAPTGSVAVTVT